MSLEGLRAWIAEVERKLGKRTRVFLALAVIAIGLGGAALYLAIDTRNDAVSEGDVQTLQGELESRIDEAAAGATTPTTPPVEVEPTPVPQPEESQPKQEGGANGGGSQSGGGGASGGGAGTGGSVPPGATGGAANSAEIEKLLENAQERNAEAEAKQRSEGSGGK